MTRLLGLPFRLPFGVARLVGRRRVLVFGTGVAVGLLAAPRPGRELRATLRRLVEERTGALTDPELLERVRTELVHHPRTWHLPQPELEVSDYRVTLRGEVPSEAARHDLVRTAAALPGVAGVDDRLVVTGTPAGA